MSRSVEIEILSDCNSQRGFKFHFFTDNLAPRQTIRSIAAPNIIFLPLERRVGDACHAGETFSSCLKGQILSIGIDVYFNIYYFVDIKIFISSALD
jgi:hypothetical protein